MTMYENEQGPQGLDFEEAFAEAVATIREDDDAGIASYEAHLKEVEDYIITEYISQHKELDYDDLEDINTELHDLWEHRGDIATVSGRIYVVDVNEDEDEDEDEDENVPKEWGEARTDEFNETYYIVDDIALQSLGVEMDLTYDEDGDLTGAKAMYTFAFPDDEEGRTAVYAYVSDLFRHEYARPTTHEAITRLESDWPEQASFVKDMFIENEQTPSYKKLRHITRELQDDLIHSETFRVLLEEFIQSFASYNDSDPYGVVVKGAIEYYDGGKNPLYDERSEVWLSVGIKGKLSLFGLYPKVTFVCRADGTVECAILLAVYNHEDDDTPEYIRCNVEAISSFRPTRAAKSLLSRALFNSSIQEKAADILKMDEEAAELSVIGIESNEPLEAGETPEALDIVETPRFIQELIAVENTLASVARLIKSRQKIRYSTKEEALKAAELLVTGEVVNLVRSRGISLGYTYVVSGPSVLVPNSVASDGVDVGEGVHPGFTYKVDVNEPVIPLTSGDSYKGFFANIAPSTKTLKSYDGEITGYAVGVLCMIQSQDVTHSPLNNNGVSLVDISVSVKASAPMDGTAEIKSIPLENYREAQTSLEKLKRSGVNQEIIKLLRSFQQAFYDNIDARDLVEFTQTELFPQLDTLSAEAAEQASSIATTAEFLERTLTAAPVTVRSDAFYTSKNGRFEEYDLTAADNIVAGVVVDVRTDIKEDSIFLAVKTPTSDVVVYVRMGGITQFSF